MTTSRFLLAFTLSLALVSTAAAAGGNVFIGNGLVAPGNEGPYGAELRGKCLMHWTAACDEAFDVREVDRQAEGTFHRPGRAQALQGPQEGAPGPERTAGGVAAGTVGHAGLGSKGIRLF